MLLQIKILREVTQLKDVLGSDGWRIVDDLGDTLTLRHDQITTEREARHRLQCLGLLTSGRLCIRFSKSKRPSGRRQFAVH